VALALALGFGWAQLPGSLPEAPVTTFGVTVVDPSGLKGDIYRLRRGTQRLPDFGKMKPIGSVYTSSLNIPLRDFRDGFPGVTHRFEWFAIDYNGNFYVDRPGEYHFALASDDGSKLYIDGEKIIDNDGLHTINAEFGVVELAGGIHRLRLSYFQGPRIELALILAVAPPGGQWRIFSTEDFRPPRNPEDWKYGKPDELTQDVTKR
jgi:hypothetical protein